ncbi:carbohydrate kinase family protein [Candidatus Uhrbacteria bacterium]|nr:carbohydrate kinase family protein [Candidatus Uhrbacteria bacterium]
MYDIVSIGDATVDVFLQINEASVMCEIQAEQCQLCLNYADKIPVEGISRVPGAGNASNNAVGSARIGMKAAVWSILGDDDVGHDILAHWKKEKVDTRHALFDRKRGTNYSTVLNFKGERTILVYHEKRDYKFPVTLDGAKWVYYTSLGKGSEKLHRPLLRYVKKAGAKLVFNPGTFQLKLGNDRLQPLIAASELTIVNKQEAERLVGDETPSIKALLLRLKALGCRLAVITDGEHGSFAYDGAKYWQLGIFDVPVIERTGCGDSYATAMVAALHFGLDLPEAMRWGTGNAASVIGKIGPQAGLLKRTEMEKMLKRFAKVKAREI